MRLIVEIAAGLVLGQAFMLLTLRFLRFSLDRVGLSDYRIRVGIRR